LGLDFVDSKHLEQCIEVLSGHALHGGVLHPVEVSLGISDFLVEQLSDVHLRELVGELVHLLGQVGVDRLSAHLHLAGPLLESDQLVAEAKPGSTLGVHPLGAEVLARARAGRLLHVGVRWVGLDSLGLQGVNAGVALLVHAGCLSVQVVRPGHLLKTPFAGGEVLDDFSIFDVQDSSVAVLSRRDHQGRILVAPGHRQDALGVDVLVSGQGVVRVSEVPDIDRWIGVVVIRNHELSWDFWIPHHLGFFGLNCLLFTSLLVFIGLSKVVVVIFLALIRLRLGELEN
jgi:hypothetical protein